jgi:hypothetical protein
MSDLSQHLNAPIAFYGSVLRLFWLRHRKTAKIPAKIVLNPQ